jgi:hypothetical protein
LITSPRAAGTQTIAINSIRILLAIEGVFLSTVARETRGKLGGGNLSQVLAGPGLREEGGHSGSQVWSARRLASTSSSEEQEEETNRPDSHRGHEYHCKNAVGSLDVSLLVAVAGF